MITQPFQTVTAQLCIRIISSKFWVSERKLIYIPYWNEKLGESFKEVKAKNKEAAKDGQHFREREAKHKRNRHSELNKKNNERIL